MWNKVCLGAEYKIGQVSFLKIGCTMGTGHSTRRNSFDANGEVNFDHFQILRAIGKGSFGKVCIVQKKDTKQMFAMKYMNKAMCARQSAITNVVRELEMLTRLDHPFLVNLWYAFQDEEDLFMVVDLFLGGDLRYHMQQERFFREECVKFYLCELALVLDYLRTQRIIHRDIKPDNILLDEQGHCHVTDFNIATQLQEDELATSTSGTRPYMAPEVYGVAIQERRGYSFPVDWWSMGVSLYELLRKRRPFSMHCNDSMHDTWVMLMTAQSQAFHLHNVSDGMKDVLRLLLEFEPKDRMCSLAQLQQHSYVADVDFDALLGRQITPPFTPSNEQLNCDPTYELEEMIIETKPLHKKKKRLAKQNSRQSSEVIQALCCQMSGCADTSVHDKEDLELQKLTKQFQYYNRDMFSDQGERRISLGRYVRPSSPTNIKASSGALETACLDHGCAPYQRSPESPTRATHAAHVTCSGDDEFASDAASSSKMLGSGRNTSQSCHLVDELVTTPPLAQHECLPWEGCPEKSCNTDRATFRKSIKKQGFMLPKHAQVKPSEHAT